MNNCKCGFNINTQSVFPDNPALAQAYIPIQQMGKIFTPEEGLKLGTIYPELVRPYEPLQSIREIEYLSNNTRMQNLQKGDETDE